MSTCYLIFVCFCQTDICGIKWRKLIADPDCCASVDHLDDPVLVSYSRCIQSDILCVWRRVQHSTDHRVTDHLSCNKELWLFWYGEEPSNLDKLLSSDLKGNVDRGQCQSKTLPFPNHYILKSLTL